MAPTLRDGSLALTFGLPGRAAVRRGDVVVAESDELATTIIKRVIGLPGETVIIEDGRVRIDGHPVDEPYASHCVFSGTFHVPADHYFLLGDNRDASVDSRSWRQPFLARSALRGRVRCRRRASAPRNS